MFSRCGIGGAAHLVSQPGQPHAPEHGMDARLGPRVRGCWDQGASPGLHEAQEPGPGLLQAWCMMKAKMTCIYRGISEQDYFTTAAYTPQKN